jgi:hypothetical protein
MQTTAYLVNATHVVLDLFMIVTKTRRKNKYMLSGNIVQYWLGILLYVIQWDRHLPCLEAARIFSCEGQLHSLQAVQIFPLGRILKQPWGSINISVGKTINTHLRQYKYLYREGQLHCFEAVWIISLEAAI